VASQPAAPAPTAAPVAPATGPAGAPPVAAADRPAAPTGVRFPGLDTDAPVLAVGVDAAGEMEVPTDVATVGWYRFGPAPGSPTGSAVLSGHVDDRLQGRGAFYRLSDLEPGDPVEITRDDGTSVAFRVVDVRRVPKEQLPVDELFARAGAPRLTLVTCGGEFDDAARSYRDNVVVVAEPA
jgi:hypothetical protein